jgi:transcription elongation GreA/GreB family factor
MGTSESAHEKFRRLAERRVVRTIRDLRLIGNLSNRSNYRYERAEVDKIFRVLEREMKQARARFETESNEDEIDFRL